jgi:hypothetical protein
MDLKIAHISLNVFQSDTKRESDIRKVFARGNHIITHHCISHDLGDQILHNVLQQTSDLLHFSLQVVQILPSRKRSILIR